MEFVKGHATANDFILIDDLDDEVEVTAELARALCDRRRGIGADGLLRLTAPPDPDAAEIFMDYRNADGSPAAICGNGLRLVAKHVVDDALIDTGDRLRVATRAGVRPVQVHRGGDGRVEAATVDMGPPAFAAEAIPFTPRDANGTVEPVEQLAVGGEQVSLSPLSMGNPHAVVLVEDVQQAAVGTLGALLESHGAFPERTNVEFAEVVDDSRIRLRVWERGVGETASCGTGVCAAVVALSRRGLVGPQVEVTTPGGVLEVDWQRPADPAAAGTASRVWLTGPVVEVARGRVDAGWLARARSGAAHGRVLQLETREGSP